MIPKPKAFRRITESFHDMLRYVAGEDVKLEKHTLAVIRFEDQAWSWLMTTAENNHQTVDQIVNDVILSYANKRR